MAIRKKTTRLSPKTRKQLIAVYNEELRAAGLGTFDDLERLIIEASPPNAINAALLGTIECILNRMSEPTPQELRNIVSELKGKLRYAFRPLMAQTTLEIKKKLLRKPSGGRGKKLTLQQESQACDEVSALKFPRSGQLLWLRKLWRVNGRLHSSCRCDSVAHGSHSRELTLEEAVRRHVP